MGRKITYLLLKIKPSMSRMIKIIQNHGFTSRFLNGSYGRSPNTLSKKLSNQEYSLLKKDIIVPLEKRFLINSIIHRF